LNLPGYSNSKFALWATARNQIVFANTRNLNGVGPG
jgi:hypothetical protein